jgi:hypothetical protein
MKNKLPLNHTLWLKKEVSKEKFVKKMFTSNIHFSKNVEIKINSKFISRIVFIDGK